MDTAQLGEWSRLLLTGALAAYLVAGMAYAAELFTRRQATHVVTARERELVIAGDRGAQELSGSNGVSAQFGSPPDLTSPDDRAGGPDLIGEADRMGRIGLSVSVLATLFLAAGVLTRALAVERVPWANMHEFSITGSLVAAAIFLGVARTKAGRSLAPWLVLLLILTLAMAITVLYVAPGPLVTALNSYWLVIHVGMAATAFGLFTVAAVVSGLQIASARAERRDRPTSLPSSGTLDKLAYRLIAVAFPLWTLGPLILGSVWAEVSWGRYWGWDPKEVWALITWLAYAAYLHARATAGWKGTKASGVALVGYATVLFSYFAVNIVFNGLHSYGGL
jgi:cytochrome c-type biogenesis protein CcsB